MNSKLALYVGVMFVLLVVTSVLLLQVDAVARDLRNDAALDVTCTTETCPDICDRFTVRSCLNHYKALEEIE